MAIIITCFAVTGLIFSCRPAPEKLFDAIEQNDAQQVKTLIDKRADVNVSKDNMTALSLAAKKGNLEIVEALIAAGADVNNQLLIISPDGPPVNLTAILYAVDGGHTEVVKALLAANANANNGNFQEGNSVLVIAAMSGNADNVDALIRAGAKVNEQDGVYSALMGAADKGNIEAVKLLLAAGADVNAATKNIIDATQSGLTALMFAAFNGHTEVVKLLIEAGADISLKSGGGNSARDIAAYKGYNETVSLIDAAGQGINK